MAQENFAAIPANRTYFVTQLVYKRIQHLEARLESLRPTQYVRRRRYEVELADLNVAFDIMRRAQDEQVKMLVSSIKDPGETEEVGK